MLERQLRGSVLPKVLVSVITFPDYQSHFGGSSECTTPHRELFALSTGEGSSTFHPGPSHTHRSSLFWNTKDKDRLGVYDKSQRDPHFFTIHKLSSLLPISPSIKVPPICPSILSIHQSMHNTQLSTATTSTTITTAAICTTIAILYHVLLYSKHCSRTFTDCLIYQPPYKVSTIILTFWIKKLKYKTVTWLRIITELRLNSNNLFQRPCS